MAEVCPSEEKTEPFTTEELQARLQGSIHVDEFDDVRQDTVPLDALIVEEDHHKQGIRILVRPLTRNRSVSPGNDNVQWLALRAEVADLQQSKSRVLAVTQTSKDINFSIRIPQGDEEDRPPLWSELYYNPSGDGLILWNRSDVPIILTRVSPPIPETGAIFGQDINPGGTQELSPGSWRINIYTTPVLDFRILEKRPATLLVPRESADSSSNPDTSLINSLGKRSFLADADDEASNGTPEKRARREEGEGEHRDDEVIVFDGQLILPFSNVANTKEVAVSNGHALLEIQKDETAFIPGRGLDQYQLTRREQIAVTSASSVFTAEHSQVLDSIITVKVLKTRGPGNGSADTRPQDTHRDVIRQADVWLREYRNQEELRHESIVRLYGGDARYLSLYMEHVDGKDLAAGGVWREPATELFMGDRQDALRILRDITGALNFVHEKGRIHNDIKPANILYSRDRGAVLCDFGLSTSTKDPATNGGTPYYVPPEFFAHKLRGPASDVWALGVTMLYVLRKIAFPEARGRKGHPKQLYWKIADLHRRHHYANRPSSAAAQMHQWLAEVNEAKAHLNPRDRIEFLVLQMLTPNPGNRITMKIAKIELSKEKPAGGNAVGRVSDAGKSK
ncbi:kinase-like protein [Durotheca rogersii]|uniref:kinase-like protein n=1 Tax=Durotheca rogersii TaxID=419775 RepID=UPI0022204C60|nr:kinase-like protein [Durotheca rogersii]KAI5865704.1 kinase-like protein [Durotheca rogersii]